MAVTAGFYRLTIRPQEDYDETLLVEVSTDQGATFGPFDFSDYVSFHQDFRKAPGDPLPLFSDSPTVEGDPTAGVLRLKYADTKTALLQGQGRGVTDIFAVHSNGEREYIGPGKWIAKDTATTVFA